jgi:hypothetical protein
LPLHNNNKNAPLLQQNKKGKIQIKENEKKLRRSGVFLCYLGTTPLSILLEKEKKTKCFLFYFLFNRVLIQKPPSPTFAHTLDPSCIFLTFFKVSRFSSGHFFFSF